MLEELKAKRADLLAKMKELNAKDTMTDEDVNAFAQLDSEFERVERDIKIAKTEAKLTNEVDEPLVTQAKNIEADTEYKSNFDKYLAGIDLSNVIASMTEGADADGGYTVPESYQNTVVRKLNDLSATRSISTVLTTTSTTNIPTEGTAPTFAWIDEEGAYGETKSTFGNKKLGAYKLGGIIKVSEELLKDTSINFDAYMAGQIALGIDKAEAPAFAIGDGVGKPTGYVTTATVGASSTTAATDAVTADELIDIFYDLKAEYRKNATWRMTDKTEKAIRKLKDGNGNYLYDASLDKQGRPSLLGRPIVIDNSMPEMGAGNKFIVIGDFSSFQIADRGGMTIQRLNELYAGNGMIGFKVTKRVDAKVIIEEAFNAGKNATA